MADIIDYNKDLKNIVEIIERSKARAIKAVNVEMIDMYWQKEDISVKRRITRVGENLSCRILLLS